MKTQILLDQVDICEAIRQYIANRNGITADISVVMTASVAYDRMDRPTGGYDIKATAVLEPFREGE